MRDMPPRCWLCPRCRTVFLGRPCRRHGGRAFGSLGAAVAAWADWWEVWV